MQQSAAEIVKIIPGISENAFREFKLFALNVTPNQTFLTPNTVGRRFKIKHFIINRTTL